jgi:hypothetical protein
VEQLERNVERLENELAEERSNVSQAPPSGVTSTVPQAPQKPVILIFHDGSQIESQGYVVADQTLWFSTSESGFQKAPLSTLDLDKTRNANLERGINFLGPDA